MCGFCNSCSKSGNLREAQCEAQISCNGALPKSPQSDGGSPWSRGRAQALKNETTSFEFIHHYPCGFAQGSSTSCVINTEHLSQALYTSFKADTNPKRAQTLDAITPISHEVSAGHIKYKVDNVFDGAFSASNAKVEREIEENIKYDSKLVEITDAEILDFSQFVNEEMADTGISDFSQFVNNDLRTTGFRRSLPYLFEIYPSKNSLTYQLIPSDNSKSPLIEYRQLFR
jgi:hypothetical protein